MTSKIDPAYIVARTETGCVNLIYESGETPGVFDSNMVMSPDKAREVGRKLIDKANVIDRSNR